jgi:hypothetical protein
VHGTVLEVISQQDACEDKTEQALLGKFQNALFDVPDLAAGNGSQLNHKAQSSDSNIPSPPSAHVSSLPIAENKIARSVTTHERVKGNNDRVVLSQELGMFTPVKRNKRREGSIDEDTSTRAERLKARKNLDESGMFTSKSSLLF